MPLASPRGRVPLEVVVRPAAADDLERLYDHIAADDAGRAIGFVRRIRQHCERLAIFPQAGRKRDDLRPGLRLLAFERRVVIAYAIDATQVRILRVFYGGRDVEALLSESEPDE